jgi:hypothetical protein
MQQMTPAAVERAMKLQDSTRGDVLRCAQLTTVAAANQFLRSEYVKEFNRRFNVPAAERGTAFVPARLKDLDLG